MPLLFGDRCSVDRINVCKYFNPPMDLHTGIIRKRRAKGRKSSDEESRLPKIKHEFFLTSTAVLLALKLRLRSTSSNVEEH
ncbi:unnamed protein product [Nesidiocoris tenuis]|uniref:Uncharacterized protein n=1 Tax=Nesidiocoris tenuis TaxID=355587 RepID=A0A6H5HIL0_9HEMI|nr:unnamed protein product [Nesidiocoris tenuis]